MQARLSSLEAMYESPVKILGKDLGARLICTGSSHQLTLREARGVQKVMMLDTS